MDDIKSSLAWRGESMTNGHGTYMLIHAHISTPLVSIHTIATTLPSSFSKRMRAGVAWWQARVKGYATHDGALHHKTFSQFMIVSTAQYAGQVLRIYALGKSRMTKIGGRVGWYQGAKVIGAFRTEVVGILIIAQVTPCHDALRSPGCNPPTSLSPL